MPELGSQIWWRVSAALEIFDADAGKPLQLSIRFSFCSSTFALLPEPKMNYEVGRPTVTPR